MDKREEIQFDQSSDDPNHRIPIFHIVKKVSQEKIEPSILYPSTKQQTKEISEATMSSFEELPFLGATLPQQTSMTKQTGLTVPSQMQQKKKSRQTQMSAMSNSTKRSEKDPGEKKKGKKTTNLQMYLYQKKPSTSE